MSDIEIAFDLLKNKQFEQNIAFSYYDGEHTPRYTFDKLANLFAGFKMQFIMNLCGVVVDSVAERLQLTGVSVVDKRQNDILTKIWKSTGLKTDELENTQAALVTGESFIVCWNENGTIQAFQNDPRLITVVYDEFNPKVKKFAAKWYKSGDYIKFILYYPDKIEHYSAKAKNLNEISGVGSIQLDQGGSGPNPYGVIPVFHFRKNKRLTVGELKNVIPLQDSLNKIFADLMVGSEFGALGQRYVISHADLSGLRNSPNEIWVIPAADGIGQPAAVGEFSQTDLTPFLSAIDNLSKKLAAITRLPKHYFMEQGGDPSGEALRAMEAPLCAKAQSYIDMFSPVWAEVAQFLLLLAGERVELNNIIVSYARPETVLPLTDSQVIQNSVNAGMPLTTALKRAGWSQDSITEMLEDKKELTDTEGEQLAAALLNAQRNFDRGL